MVRDREGKTQIERNELENLSIKLIFNTLCKDVRSSL